jgi:hypothetical protein
LGCIEFCNKVEESFADAYSLIVREDHKAADAEIVSFHFCVNNRYESDGFVLVYCGITSYANP